jgi:hypothetical protein
MLFRSLNGRDKGVTEVILILGFIVSREYHEKRYGPLHLMVDENGRQPSNKVNNKFRVVPAWNAIYSGEAADWSDDQMMRKINEGLYLELLF